MGMVAGVCAKLLNAVLAGQPYTGPNASNLWYGLFTTTPNTAGLNGVEVSGAGYVRVQADFSTALTVGTLVRVACNGAPTWPPAGGNWGTITSICVMDAPTGGNVVVVAPLSPSLAVNTGDIFQVSPGNFSLYLTL
ncbi:hypothetical protein [Bordetella flabilis]|uniref:phage tail fiber protein n=1 Tax=Bordetella flabilis TaxID=463014 RepID=UPI000AA46367|nr:hypothetical protein [Bordetella flabilis]